MPPVRRPFATVIYVSADGRQRSIVIDGSPLRFEDGDVLLELFSLLHSAVTVPDSAAAVARSVTMVDLANIDDVIEYAQKHAPLLVGLLRALGSGRKSVMCRVLAARSAGVPASTTPVSAVPPAVDEDEQQCESDDETASAETGSAESDISPEKTLAEVLLNEEVDGAGAEEEEDIEDGIPDDE